MALLRRSDDVDREFLFAAGGASSAAVTERARITITPSDDCHLWRYGVTVLPGATSSAESVPSYSWDVFRVCSLAHSLWAISLVVHSGRNRGVDRPGARRGSHVRFAGVPGAPS